MSVVISLGITGVHPSPSSSSSMASNREGSKDTIENAIGDAVEQGFMSFPIYEDTKFFIDKEIKMKWKDINNTFSGTFEENLEDRRVYVNIHKSSVFQIS